MDEAYIIGVSQINSKRLGTDQTILDHYSQMIDEAIKDTRSPTLTRAHINALVSKHPYASWGGDPSVAPGTYSNYVASALQFLPYNPPSQPSTTHLTHPSFITKTIDTGGATPLTLVNEAKNMIQSCGASVVAVVMADAPNSIPRDKLFTKYTQGDYTYENDPTINKSIIDPTDPILSSDITSSDFFKKQPIVARLYSAHTYRFMETYGKINGIKRYHLSLISVLMSHQAYLHNESLSNFDYKKRGKKLTLNKVKKSPEVWKDINDPNDEPYRQVKLYECARLSDGVMVFLVASKRFIIENEYFYPKNNRISEKNKNRFIEVSAFGEASNAFFLQSYYYNAKYKYNKDLFDFYPMKYAVTNCLQQYIRRKQMSEMNKNDFNNSKSIIIDWFGIYDCFPIAFLTHLVAARIVESVDKVPEFLENWYKYVMDNDNKNGVYPINTHGGLLGFGAPGALPAGQSLIEAVRQLRGEVKDVEPKRQIKFAKYDGNGNKRDRYHALVTGNGIIFGQASVLLLSKYKNEFDEDNGDENGDGNVVKRFEIDLRKDIQTVNLMGGMAKL